MNRVNTTDKQKVLTFTLVALVFLGAALALTIFPLLVLPLEDSLNITHSSAGLLYTIMLIASAGGRLLESFGANQLGKDPFILYPGFLMVLGTLIFALGPAYWVISLGALIMGLGNGLFTPAGFAAVSELFPEERGKFVGLYDSIFPLSALVAYGVATLGTMLGSWRMSIGLVGIYLLMATILLNWMYSNPEGADGTSPDEDFSPVKEIKGAFEKARGCPVFRKMVLLVLPVSIFANGAMNFLPAYLVQAREVSQGIANLLYMIFMGLSIPGKQLSGRILDRKGFRWTFLLAIGFALFGFAVFSQVPGLWALALGIFAVAPARGGSFTVMHGHLLNSLPEESVDLLYGLFMFSLGVSSSIGPGLAGVLIDNLGFRLSFTFLLLILLPTLPIALSVKNSKGPLNG